MKSDKRIPTSHALIVPTGRTNHSRKLLWYGLRLCEAIESGRHEVYWESDWKTGKRVKV